MKLNILLILLACLLCSGCVTVQVETIGTLPQKGALGNYSNARPVTCKATYSRFWSDVEGFEVTVCGGKMKLVKSSANDELINSLVPLLVNGAAIAK